MAFVGAGVNHFINPQFYVAMIPPFFPVPELLNQVSGGAEILGGLGILLAQTRKWAGWGLIALLVAVFPANIYVAWLGKMEGTDVPGWGLWLRLPFQAVFIAWVWWVTKPARDA